MILITGGAGFIGSNLVHYWLETTSDVVINVDKLTYAGNLQNLARIGHEPRHVFVRADIGDAQAISRLLEKYQPRAVINLAAESHVDRSIDDPDTFIQTNVVGTLRLLKTVYAYWTGLPPDEKSRFRFLHVSTDEVYGSLGAGDPPFRETNAYAPNNPYSASKAASDHLVRSFIHTYGLPALTTNCSNNFGPFQFPEKLIPLAIHRALADQPIPIYGDGLNVRDWLYVADHCAAVQCVLKSGRIGEVYNIGAANEKTNLDIAQSVCAILDRERPRSDGKSYRDQISFVTDRPGHDRRYAIDAGKIARELGWKPKEDFETALGNTIRWYLENQEWVRNVTTGAYREHATRRQGERVGAA
jgi:dTDP-glucose 4,6-dehydratase